MEGSELKLLHFADLHLGVESGGRLHPETGLNQRIVDVCERFDELCDTVEKEGVHAVLFAGDAFKNQHPTPTLQSLFAARVRRLHRAGAAIFLLIGNHDLPRMGGLAHPFSIYEALEVEGVVIGDRARVYRLPLEPGAPAAELQVAALPHFSRHQALARAPEAVPDPEKWVEEQVTRTVKALATELDPSLPSVFVGHCHVNQAEIGEGQTMFGISDVEVSLSTLTSGRSLPYYALGHVHKRQVLSEDPFVAYAGSLERVDFGEGERVDVPASGAVRRREADKKGFYRAELVDGGADGWRLAAPPQFRSVRARSFVTLRVSSIAHDDPMAALNARIERAREAGVDLTDAFVRISGSVDPADRARLQPGAARQLIPEAYSVRLAFETHDAPSARDPRFAKQMSEIDALEKYLETRTDWQDDRAELARLGRELITEVGA